MYLLLKALHVCAVLVFVGGLLVDSVILSASSAAARHGGAPSRALFEAVRRWDRRVTTPAILLTWILGFALAILGGWLHAGWLMVKFAIVFGLSAVHGMLAGAMRRAAGDAQGHLPKPRDRYLPLVVVGGVSLVALLVIMKPF